MAKKTVKTTEQLTEEFFALERAEYEKRVPEKAFPRLEVKALEELTEPADPAELPDLPVETPPDAVEEKPLGKVSK